MNIFYASHLTLTTTQMPMKSLQSWIETDSHQEWQKSEIPLLCIFYFFSLWNIHCKRHNFKQKEKAKETEDVFWLKTFKLGTKVSIFILVVC